jgi:Fur family ferric uptake transcriptional regulator
MLASTDKLLEHHKLRRTKIRLEILNIFLDRNYALAHSEIEETISKEFDRVTIYRTLKSFEEQGLIHRVLDESGAAKYALCLHEHNETHKHHDQHIHFNCVQCGHTFCLENIPIPEIKLPAPYQLQKFDFLAQGICKNCVSL